MFATIRFGLILILLNICSSSQSFVAIALKPKNYEGKFVIPPCAFINNGATLIVAKQCTQRYLDCETVGFFLKISKEIGGEVKIPRRRGLSRLFQLAYFVKCKRTLLELNS